MNLTYIQMLFFFNRWPLSSVFPTRSRIIEGKEKDDPKTIPLKIFAKDIGNCAYVRFTSLLLSDFYCFYQHKHKYCLIAPLPVFKWVNNDITGRATIYVTYKQLDVSMMSPKCFHQAKTLAVSNTDSTTDVIRMALLQFGISVSNERPLLILSSICRNYTQTWCLNKFQETLWC